MLNVVNLDKVVPSIMLRIAAVMLHYSSALLAFIYPTCVNAKLVVDAYY